MGKIFVSYRRAFDAGEARSLYLELRAAFSDAAVFMDVDDLLAGRPFDEALAEALDQCSVLIAVIGPQWIDEIRKRADGEDFVRLEIGRALSRRIIVVPALVNGARMPERAALPQEIGALTRYHAVRLEHDKWGRDVRDLIAQLAEDTGLEAAAGGGEAVRPTLPTPPPGTVLKPVPPHRRADAWDEMCAFTHPNPTGDRQTYSVAYLDPSFTTPTRSAFFVDTFENGERFYIQERSYSKTEYLYYCHSRTADFFSARLIRGEHLAGSLKDGGLFRASLKSSVIGRINHILPHKEFRDYKQIESPFCGVADIPTKRDQLLAFPLTQGAGCVFLLDDYWNGWRRLDTSAELFGAHAVFSRDAKFALITGYQNLYRTGHSQYGSHQGAPAFRVDLQTGDCRRADGSANTHFTLYPDGSLLEISVTSGVLRARRILEDGTGGADLLAEIEVTDVINPVCELSMQPTGRYLACCLQSVIYVIDLRTGQKAAEIFDAREPIYSPDGNRLYFAKTHEYRDDGYIADAIGAAPLHLGRASRDSTFAYLSGVAGQYLPSLVWADDGRHAAIRHGDTFRFLRLTPG